MKKIMLMLVVGVMTGSAMATVIPPNLVGDASFEQMDAAAGGAEGPGFLRNADLTPYDPVTDTGTEWYTDWYAGIANGPYLYANWGVAYPAAGVTGDQYLGTFGGGMNQDIDLVAGYTYELKMWAAYIAGDGTLKHQILGVPLLDAVTGEALVDNDGWLNGWLDSQIMTWADGDGDGTDDWEQYTWTFMAGETGTAKVMLYSPGAGIDDVVITVVSDDISLTPTPSNGAVNVLTDQVLSWTDVASEPNIVTVDYDVYFDPNESLVATGDASVKVGANQAGASYTPSPALDVGKTYYWRVDVNADFDYVAGTEPNMIKGNVWSFTTVGPSPVIDPYDNISTAVSLQPVTLSAVVSDADNNVAGVEWELLADDYEYPAGATVPDVTDTTSDLYAPTATFVADANGIYKVKLTVTDEDSNVAEAIAMVWVLETACDLAPSTPGWTGYNYYDRDTDCDVDLSDYALFAAEWLDDRNATDPVIWTGAIGYIPVSNGLLNGNFETGDFTGWWGGTEITDAGADVYEGSYAAKLVGISGLNTWTAGEGDYYNLPAGNHSVKFQYKGDLAEIVIGLNEAMGQDPAPRDGSGAALANSGTTGFETLWIVETATVPSYTQYEIQFTVDTEGLGNFYIGSSRTIGTGYFDDFQLVLDSH